MAARRILPPDAWVGVGRVDPPRRRRRRPSPRGWSGLSAARVGRRLRRGGGGHLVPRAPARAGGRRRRAVRRTGRRPGAPGSGPPRPAAVARRAGRGSPAWEGGPLGRGRPGWHIECAAIAAHHSAALPRSRAGAATSRSPTTHMSASHMRALGHGEGVLTMHAGHGLPRRREDEASPAATWSFVLPVARPVAPDPEALRLALAGHHWRSDWEWHPADIEGRARPAGPVAGGGARHPSGRQRCSPLARSIAHARSRTTSTVRPPWRPSTRGPGGCWPATTRRSPTPTPSPPWTPSSASTFRTGRRAAGVSVRTRARAPRRSPRATRRCRGSSRAGPRTRRRPGSPPPVR